jgi:hypothetical protein
VKWRKERISRVKWKRRKKEECEEKSKTLKFCLQNKEKIYK